jgi:predicted transcriptional regulator
LRELAKLTGLSVPGVLRHLDAMDRAGLVREVRVTSKQMPIRKLYSIHGIKVVDFSVGNLSIFSVSRPTARESAQGSPSLHWLATEILIGRRRIREKAKRLARSIDELLENEESLASAIESLGADDDERLILLTMFTEETAEEAEAVLTKIQGLKDARRSIDKALGKAKQHGAK